MKKAMKPSGFLFFLLRRPGRPISTPPTAPAGTPAATSAASTPPTTTQTPTTTTTQPATTTTPATTAPGTTSQTTTTSDAITTPSTTSAPTTTSAIVAPPVTSMEVTTTNSQGDAITITVTSSNAASSSSAAAAPTNSSNSDNSDGGGGGLSTGSIVGMSVAAGVAVIGIVGFFVWKFTRKRFSDFDDNEAIKWPELNSHSGPDNHPLPAHEAGRAAGFDTGSEVTLSRVNSISNYSTPDFGANGPDPYAVPPLPHLNPSQPYRDDPAGSTGYYDPYHGPVPGTIENGASDWQPEAYPMTQLGGPTGRGSPAPDYMYEGGRQSPAVGGAMYGRSSPAPQVAYTGRASPGPQVAYGGRASPGPQVAYGGRASPGPQAAYSTGPSTGYDAYGTR
ncbi:hypothetical protein P691DRAFT_795042 [Macrolepiota fuliginosa MF-IS2]|uniref:Transmembrane protein n=1 Tax=Macrolepiota fuliginosa MF-IS2 TaxID=1400762 RepID=A0A9P5XKY8_9AGAR|nr:hypothetical protein P691DRAFT_795042 [Macrolepiota fuliginosa MF-IS2]